MNLFPDTSNIVMALNSNFETISSDEITVNFAYSFSRKGIFESHQSAYDIDNKIKQLFYVRSYSEFRFDFKLIKWRNKISLRPYVFSKKIAYRMHQNFCKKNGIKSKYIVLGIVYEVGAWQAILKKIKILKTKKISKTLLNKKIFITSINQINHELNKINSNFEYNPFIGKFITLEEFLNINNIPFEIYTEKNIYDLTERIIRFLNLFDFDLFIKVLGRIDPFFYLLRELINEQ